MSRVPNFVLTSIVDAEPPQLPLRDRALSFAALEVGDQHGLSAWAAQRDPLCAFHTFFKCDKAIGPVVFWYVVIQRRGLDPRDTRFAKQKAETRLFTYILIFKAGKSELLARLSLRVATSACPPLSLVAELPADVKHDLKE